MLVKSKLIEIIIHEERCTGCRICQLICSSIYKNKYSPTEAFIQIVDVYELIPKISFLDGCTHCGQCANFCLYGALELKEGEK
ncbi:MAG: hypothetical protein CEE42_05150 [Promethearchaeota archaeon Loki_b31]|nr:MAG: hypothetical protein CEE42_05150 [Candidatus Lokiarchaeota archaeon Loki_b31]